MKHYILHCIILLSLTICPTVATAQYQDNVNYAEIIANFNQRLADGCSRGDSIIILSNVFDLGQTSGLVKHDSIAEIIYQVAVRANDARTALEMVRMRANTNFKNIDTLDMLARRTESFEDSDIKSETATFIAMQRNNYLARHADKSEQESRFEEELRDVTLNPPKDVYSNIALLHAVCVNISQETHGELLADYVTRLGELVDKLPASALSVKNAFHVQAALAYALSDEPQKSIDEDLKLLQVIDSMSTYYASIGRPYRNFGANRYVIYTRILGNWEGLTAADVEKYYRLALASRDDDPRAMRTYNAQPVPEIYYAMATKNYGTALKLLKEHVDNPALKMRRRQLLKHMITAAAAEQDKDAWIYASKEYTRLLEDYLESRIQERYKELQIIYDTYEMNRDYDALKAEALSSRSILQRIIIAVCGIALIVLIVLMFFLVRQYRRSKRLAETLAQSNLALKNESESLRKSQAELTAARDAAQRANQFKSDFIRNMSHEVSVPLNAIIEYSHLIVDCTDATDRPYLERYAEQIELNGAFLTAIVNDVLHLSEIDSMSVSLQRQLVDLRHVAELSVETIMPKISKDVEVVFDPESPNLDTFTDPRRVQQILVNLIGNAAKYTRKGRILLQCNVVNDGKTIAIAVADTGIGIPAKEKDRIFERFVKLDPEASGLGLGLPISRLLARLLGGDLELDTTYTHGARFIFTLPYTLK